MRVNVVALLDVFLLAPFRSSMLPTPAKVCSLPVPLAQSRCPACGSLRDIVQGSMKAHSPSLMPSDEGITSEEDYAAEIEELRSKFNRSVRDEHRRKVDLDQKRQQPRPQLGEEESRVSKRVQDARLRLQSQKAALLRRLQTIQVQWTMQTKPGDDSTRPPATQASTSADRGAPAFTQHIRAKFEDLRSELRSRKADVCRNVDGRSQRLISQIEMNRCEHGM